MHTRLFTIALLVCAACGCDNKTSKEKTLVVNKKPNKPSVPKSKPPKKHTKKKTAEKLTSPKFERTLDPPHKGTVNCVAFSPDGSTIVSGGGDGTIAVWNAIDGSRIKMFKAHQGHVWSLEFSSDGKTVVSGGFDGAVRIWTIGTAQETRKLNHGARVRRIAISHDGERIASGGEDKLVKLWEFKTGNLIATLRGVHTDAVIALAFNQERRLVTGGRGGKLAVWDKGNTEPVATVNVSQSAIDSIAFSRDGKSFLTAGWDGKVRKWTPPSEESEVIYSKKKTSFLDIAISPTEKSIALAGSSFYKAGIYNIGPKKMTEVDFKDTVQCVAISPKGNVLVIGGGGGFGEPGKIQVWRIPAD